VGDDKKSFLLRLPQRVFDELRRLAERDMRSINGQIEWLLREALKERGRDPDGGQADGGEPDGK
jgi:hypothetical protein